MKKSSLKDDAVYSALKENRKEVIKQSGAYPWLISIFGMVMLSALYICFSLFEALDSAWSFVFLIVFILVGFLTVPILYGVTLSVVEGTRFHGKRKWSISALFNSYYRSNYGAYNIWGVFWRSVLTLLLSDIIFASIGALIIYTAFPSLSTAFNNYLNAVSEALQANSQTPYLGDYIYGKNYLILETMTYIVSSLGIMATTFVGSFTLRRNEQVFYAATNIVADNRVNMVTRPLLYAFRRNVLPTVRKEHGRYNFLFNWPGYVVFYLAFIGFSVLFYFIKASSVFYMVAPYIAFTIATVLYAPFYYLSRLFDALFYIAYSDEIYNRLDLQTKLFIESGRKAMSPIINTLKEAEEKEENEAEVKETPSSEENSNVEENPNEVKKAHGVNNEGELDFTSKDDETEAKEDDEEEKK